MKLKYYQRGNGIGMIVTTVILMIAFAVHREQPLTDDEIRTRAAELGMIMPEELPTSEKLSDTDASVQTDDGQAAAGDAQDDEQPEQPDEKSDSGVTEEKTKDDTSDAGTSDKDEEEDKTKQEVIEQAEITIVGGEYSDDVCNKLKKAGIIEDADEFNKYLAKGGYDNLIQPGNYLIPLDADYDTIVKIITEKKR